MYILTIRTDKPEAEIGLFEGDRQLAYTTWEAHRQLAETLHVRVVELLAAASKNWDDIKGIVIYEGPGSFTGLRIGFSVANALASIRDVPIIAAAGEDWMQQGIRQLTKGEGERMVLPVYGSPPHITRPKK